MVTIAVARAHLDNFDHITAYWVGLGMKLAQVALSYGADDLHGTVIEEHIFRMAGGPSPQLQAEADLVKAIRETGRTPVQRNTFYEPIKVWEAAATATNGGEPNKQHSAVLEKNLATASEHSAYALHMKTLLIALAASVFFMEFSSFGEEPQLEGEVAKLKEVVERQKKAIHSHSDCSNACHRITLMREPRVEDVRRGVPAGHKTASWLSTYGHEEDSAGDCRPANGG